MGTLAVRSGVGPEFEKGDGRLRPSLQQRLPGAEGPPKRKKENRHAKRGMGRGQGPHLHEQGGKSEQGFIFSLQLCAAARLVLSSRACLSSCFQYCLCTVPALMQMLQSAKGRIGALREQCKRARAAEKRAPACDAAATLPCWLVRWPATARPQTPTR